MFNGKTILIGVEKDQVVTTPPLNQMLIATMEGIHLKKKIEKQLIFGLNLKQKILEQITNQESLNI